MSNDSIDDQTRRAILKGVAGTLGVAAGALGMAAFQRDRILERARGLLDREE